MPSEYDVAVILPPDIATVAVTQPGDIETVAVAIAGIQGPAGTGVPIGGTAGQTLTKVSSTNYDAAWSTLTAASVGAYPDTNPSNFIAASGAPVQSVNGSSGTVVLDAGSVGAIGTAVGLYVLNYGTAAVPSRPSAASVYWQGTAEPGTAVSQAGDLWYDADGA